MLHLLPVKTLLVLLIVAVGVAVLLGQDAGWLQEGQSVTGAMMMSRVATIAVPGIFVLALVFWRWLPFGQQIIFPYLGGEWQGNIKFEGPNGEESRKATLIVRHTILNLNLVLDTKESTSRTLAVHPIKDKAIGKNRLYYVYMNERKPGFPGAGVKYRGLAIIEITVGKKLMLKGNYFTDHGRSGTLSVTRQTPTPWWQLWH